MPELKKFTVFGERGRIGTLTAAARFLDSRSERTIELEDGKQLSVPADALKVQPDGSFYLKTAAPVAVSAPESDLAIEKSVAEEPTVSNATNDAARKMFRDGYSIETVKIGRIVAEAPLQRQEGDTLILPVIEEVLVAEKRLLLREEIRITKRREEVEQIQTITPSTP